MHPSRPHLTHTHNAVGNVNLGCTTLNVGTGSTMRIIVASFTPDGACRWSSLFTSTGDARGKGIGVDGSGRVYVG